MINGRLRDIEDCIDPEFNDLELPEGFLYPEISRAYINDPCITVVNDPLFYQGFEMSSIRVFDFRDNTIHVGAKSFIEPRFLPKEDFSGVDIILDYADALDAGKNPIFPDVPDAKPIIPHNQYIRSEDRYILEDYMVKQGFVITDPGTGYAIANQHVEFAKSDPESTVGDDFSAFSAKTVFFSPYNNVNFKDEKYKDVKMVAMEFNPFHPMSNHFITEFVWDDNDYVVRGKYKYKDIEKRFVFSLKSKKYRIHSNVWNQMIVPMKYDSMYECYDLVGNFDFWRYLKFDFKDKDIDIEPLVIEPVIYGPPVSKKQKSNLVYRRVEDRDNQDRLVRRFPYSLMTTNRIIGKGSAGRITSMYTHHSFELSQSERGRYLDVTQDVSMVECKHMVFNGHTYRLRDREIDSHDLFIKYRDKKQFCVFLKIRKSSILRGDKDLNDKGFLFKIGKKAYIINSTVEREGYSDDSFAYRDKRPYVEFIESDAKFYSFPRNAYGSIIYDFKTITLYEAKKLGDDELHAYFPLMAPIPEYAYEQKDYTQYMVDENVFDDVDNPIQYTSSYWGIEEKYDFK